RAALVLSGVTLAGGVCFLPIRAGSDAPRWRPLCYHPGKDDKELILSRPHDRPTSAMDSQLIPNQKLAWTARSVVRRRPRPTRVRSDVQPSPDNLAAQLSSQRS